MLCSIREFRARQFCKSSLQTLPTISGCHVTRERPQPILLRRVPCLVDSIRNRFDTDFINDATTERLLRDNSLNIKIHWQSKHRHVCLNSKHASTLWALGSRTRPSSVSCRQRDIRPAKCLFNCRRTVLVYCCAESSYLRRHGSHICLGCLHSCITPFHIKADDEFTSGMDLVESGCAQGSTESFVFVPVTALL